MKNHKIKDLQDFMNGNFTLLSKSLGVELVELGLCNYKKLTSENYEYWWYEVENILTLDKTKYTYDWHDLIRTSKMKKFGNALQKLTGPLLNSITKFVKIFPNLNSKI
jgi:hypothetical protein